MLLQLDRKRLPPLWSNWRVAVSSTLTMPKKVYIPGIPYSGGHLYSVALISDQFNHKSLLLHLALPTIVKKRIDIFPTTNQPRAGNLHTTPAMPACLSTSRLASPLRLSHSSLHHPPTSSSPVPLLPFLH